jgi:hypothetical protein
MKCIIHVVFGKDMLKQDFPGIYASASACSAKAQKHYYSALRLELVFLLASAVIPIMGISHWSIALLQAVVLISALTCTLLLHQRNEKPDRIWYQARALAESIKTMTWRYVSKAEPYIAESDDAECEAQMDHLFLANINQLLKDNQLPNRYLHLSASAKNITDKMKELRAKPVEERQSYYLANRIEEQMHWYEKKYRLNNLLASRFSIVIAACYCAAIFLAMMRIQFPSVQGWPTGVFVTSAVVVMSWMQAKRFSELAASYAQTGADIKHLLEVMKANERRGCMGTDQAFSNFVGDAENAFSREHTQWVARRDS